MKIIFKIAKSELNFLFYSPIAWLVLVLFTFQVGMQFSNLIENVIVTKESNAYILPLTELVFTGRPDGILVVVQQYLYLYIPLLTMGLMSKEMSSGTIKLLFSSPITNTQIILGKYIAMMIYSFMLIAILMVCVIYGNCNIKDLDLTYIFSGLLGLYLLTCAYSAVGLFMSCLSAYQIAAAMGTLALLSVLNMIGTLGQDIPIVRDITYWLSIRGRSDQMIRGLICSEDVLYFVIVSVVFVMLAIFKLSGQRKKMSRKMIYSRYVGIVVIAVVLGYMSTMPSLMTYYDATATKQRTLTPNSLAVMEKMDGGLTITTYVNLLEQNFTFALPKNQINDKKTFRQYVRFKPEIKMKYVYYYDYVNDPSLEARFPNMTLEEKARKLAENFELDFDMFLSPEEIRKQIDLSEEQNLFVRLLERENGQKTFLRIFNDGAKFPDEAEISAALKRLVRPAAKLAFLTGHGERSIYKKGERDYFQFTIDKPFRGSLLNNGFEIMELDLRGGNKIPDDLDILFIADMRQPLQPEEMEEIQHYIARGGNFVLVADAGTQEIVNPIIASLGVQFMENRIVQKTEDYSPSIVFARMTPQSEKLTGWFRWMNTWKYRVPMENAMALISTPTDDVEFIPLIVTDSTNCWNEVETKEYSAKGASLNPDAGECEQQYTMAAQVTRKLANKEQRAFIFGDADFCSNVELHRQRRGVVTGANKRILDYLFLYLTEGEFPVNTDRPGTRDRDVYLGVDDLMPAKVGFMGIFPALIAVFGIAIQIRRKRK